MKYLRCIHSNVEWRVVVAYVLCTIIAGCGGTAPLFTSDGRPTTLVQCSAIGSWAACEENASGLCPQGYDIIQQTTEGGMRNLLFACKKN